MTFIKENPVGNQQVSPWELLQNHPDAVLFFLPVWSEVEAGNKVVDFQVNYANPKATAAFNILPHQLLSQPITDGVPGKGAPLTQWFGQLLQVLQLAEKSEACYPYAHANLHYTLQCTKVNDGVMAVVRETPTHADSSLWEVIPHGLIVLTAVYNNTGSITDFTLVKANKQFGQQLQWNDAWTGKSYTQVLPVSDGLFQLKCTVVKTGEKRTYEFYHEQHQKWFLVTLSKLDADNLVATFTDISENKRLKEVQLQQYDKRLQVVFDTSLAGMYTLTPVRDEQGTIIDFQFGLVNQAVASYLGLQAEDLAGSLGSLYFPAYKTNGLFDRYVETINTGKPAVFDLHYTDGYDNYFTINVVKMGDELFGTFTDHSNLKRLQKELEASIAELKRSNTSLEQFAHAASHDLQEPLRKILLYASKLEADFGEELNDEAFGYLERINTASRRMQRLIKDLLVFAEVGAQRPDFEDVALAPLLQEVLENLEVAIAERDAVITVDALGTIKGDSLHLQQLFQNLISNSIKYSRPEEPPCISITAEKVQGCNVDFALGEFERAKDYYRILLQDNGQGFNNEQSQHIFKIFQRLPQHRNECNGTGIGLAIVQRVVENHKGFIKAEGKPGAGATFTILLPVDA